MLRECCTSGDDTQKSSRQSAVANHTGDAHGRPSRSAVARVMKRLLRTTSRARRHLVSRPCDESRGPASSGRPHGLGRATRTCSSSIRGEQDVTHRVIQWATGGVGRAAIEGVLAHPELELVGCWVHSEAKDGRRRRRRWSGGDPIGVAATQRRRRAPRHRRRLRRLQPVHGRPGRRRRASSSRARTSSRRSAGSTRRPTSASTSTPCAATAGVTLHGTGIHPGGITERFPLMVSALSGSITHVRAEEFSDIRTYGAPDVIRDWMLFGKTPEEARTSIMADALGAGFRQSVWMVADELGFDLDPRAAHDPRDGGGDRAHRLAHRADRARPRRRPALPVGGARRRRAGRSPPRSTGSWATSTSTRRGRSGPEGERFEVEVTGDPRVLVTFKNLHPESIEAGLERNPGIVATAMHCVNAVPYVCAARARPAHLPRPAARRGRAAPHLGLRPGRVGDPRPVPGRRAASPSSPAPGSASGAASPSAWPRPAPTSCWRPAPRPTSTRWPSRCGPAAGGHSWSRPTSPTRSALEHLVDTTVEELGRLDILVNNAGGAMPPAGDGHQRGLPRARLPLQRHRAVHAHQAGGARRWSTPPAGARSSTSRRGRRA